MKSGKLEKREALSAYLMLTPFFLFFILFVLYPVLRNILDSFTNYNLIDRRFIGFDNYLRLLRDAGFLRSVQNTFVYALFSILPLMLLGFSAALLVNRRTRAMYAARALLVYPYATSAVAVSMVWLFVFDPNAGPLNRLLTMVGLTPQWWLFDEALAMPCLIAVNVWKYVGYVMVIYLAALQSVPESLYDAAKVDGAGSARMVWSITLPSIQPVTFFLLVTLSVECFKTFDQVRILTNGGPVNATTTIAHQIYIRAFSEFKLGYASAMSVVLFLIVFTVAVLYLKLGRQLDE